MRGDIRLGPAKECDALSTLKNIIPAIDDEMSVQILKKFELVGKKFSSGTILVHKIDKNGPQFGKLKDIFYCNECLIYFRILVFDTIHFQKFYHAYCVSSITNKSDILINVNLVPRLPKCLSIVNKNLELVMLRYDFQ